MWFGSYNGLHKHEGTSIKVYNKSGKDSASLSSKEMHSVFEDRLGFIWAGTTGGLDKLDPKTGIIKHYKLRSAKRTDDWLGYIVSIFQDDRDDIWVDTEAGLFIIDYNTGNFTEVPDGEKSAKGVPNHGVYYKCSVVTKTGIWMYASGYIIFFDFKTRSFIHQFNNPQHKKIFNLRENNNFSDGSELIGDSLNNIYFIFHNNVLMKYNTVTEKLDSFRFEFPKNAWSCCYSLAVDYKGNVWIGFRYGGLLFFNSSSQKFTPIRYTSESSLIQSDYVYSLCEDYLKRMWVTTSNGIFIINYYDSIVQEKYLSDKKEFTDVNYIAGIISEDDKGNIYFPFSAGGLFKYNIYNRDIRHFPVTDTIAKFYNYVFTGEKDKFFVGSKGTLLLADTSSHKLVLHTVSSKMCDLLAGERSTIVWMYRYNENAVYAKKADEYLYYYNGTGSLEKLKSTGFSRQACISHDGKSLFFLSAESDIIKRDLVTLKMDTIFLARKLAALNFLYTNTRDLADDGNGNIWVTSQNGLIKYNEVRNDVFVYTTADGLLHDFSFTLCADSKKRLWVGSLGGVNLYDEKKNSFINVFPELPDKLGNYFGGSLEGKDGHIYFSIGGKLVNIDPDGFINQKIEQRLLQLDEVQVNGNTVNTSTDILSGLSYHQNRIYFRFGLLEFVDPERVRYSYQLEGLDKNWIDLGSHSEVTFNALQPGNYALHVKATDMYGNPVRALLNIPFTIEPPFWKTWWFIALVFLSIVLIVYWFIKWRVSNIRALEEGKTKLQKLTAEKYKMQFESEQVSAFFTNSLFNKNNVDDALWDVAKNLIGKLGFVDCVIYLWNDDKTALIQKAGYGPKGSLSDPEKIRYDMMSEHDVIGTVGKTGEPLIIADTSIYPSHRPNDMERLSEICVPIKYNEQLLGVIDSEHPEKDFFTSQHLQVLTTIATLIGSKIKSIEAEQRLRHQKAEMADINQQMAEVQLAALRSQMNPHFIFNALNSIKKFVIANEPDNAEKYLSKFSKLIRSILDNSQAGIVTVEKELQLLKLYLDLEQLRFGNKLTYSITVDEKINTSEIQIPSMIVQPFAENAMLHGIMHRESGGKLDICFVLHSNWLEITIEDNGVGRAKSAEYKSENAEPHHSIGIKVSEKRLEALKKDDSTPAGIQIIDLTNDSGEGCGTKVIISIPIN